MGGAGPSWTYQISQEVLEKFWWNVHRKAQNGMFPFIIFNVSYFFKMVWLNSNSSSIYLNIIYKWYVQKMNLPTVHFTS